MFQVCLFNDLSKKMLKALENLSILFVSGDRLDDVLDSLENASLKLLDWFSRNQMKTNPDKCHLLTSSTDSIAITIKDNEMLNSESEKLLGVTIDNTQFQ